MSCENCIVKKIKCDQARHCAPCQMRGFACVWIRGSPKDAVTESKALQQAHDKIASLERVIQTLSSRLEAAGISAELEVTSNGDEGFYDGLHFGLASPASSPDLGDPQHYFLLEEPYDTSPETLSSLNNSAVPSLAGNLTSTSLLPQSFVLPSPSTTTLHYPSFNFIPNQSVISNFSIPFISPNQLSSQQMATGIVTNTWG